MVKVAIADFVPTGSVVHNRCFALSCVTFQSQKICCDCLITANRTYTASGNWDYNRYQIVGIVLNSHYKVNISFDFQCCMTTKVCVSFNQNTHV